jgi:hypothetical protein
MAQMTIRSIAAGCLIILMARGIDSCSFSDPVVLAFEARPDEPIEKYIGGDLGLIRPTFARSHLVVAYRYITGRPLKAAERRGVAELMEERLPPSQSPAPQVPDLVYGDWLTTRLEAVPDAPMTAQQAPWSAFRPRTMESHANLVNDAYVTATATLRKRMSEFGAGSAPVRAWLTAQDAVFSRSPVPAADSSLPPVIRKDRDYQIASALFYADEYDKAHEKFLAIANDAESPWAPLGRYLAARSLVREATLHAPDDNPYEAHLRYKAEPMVQAEREIREVLADPNLKSIHAAAKRLLNFIEIRLRPAEYAATIAAIVARGGSPSTMTNDLADYTILLDFGIRPDDEMTDWIFTLQDGYADEPWRYRLEPPENKTLAHAVKQWRTHKSELWLIPAIVHAHAGDPFTPALMKAAESVRPESPAYLTVRYHRLRLLRDLHHEAELQTELNDILKTRGKMGPSTRNAFLELRLPLSASIDQFVRDAPREAAGLWLNEPLVQPFYYLGDDAVADINRALRLDDLVAMASRPMPDNIPATIYVAIWTRALILGHDDLALKITPQLIQWHQHEIDASLTKYMQASAEDRKYEAIDILVHFPGLTPYAGGTDTRAGEKEQKLDMVPHDQYTHENWWCRDGLTFGETIYPTRRKSPIPNPPQFAKEESAHHQAAEERKRLLEAGSGTTYVLRAVVEWANERPSDPRVPEALSRAIKTTQWGCPDSRTRKLAETAFDVLHSKYGKTKWAKETPYWYGGRE